MIKKIFPNFKELNSFAAEKVVEIAAESIKNNNQFSIALAGGSTPKSLYQLLASEKFKKQNRLVENIIFSLATSAMFCPTMTKAISKWRTKIFSLR